MFTAIRDDIRAIRDRDPASGQGFWGLLEIFLCYSGLHAIWMYRIYHRLHRWHIPVLPRFLSQLARFLTGIEVHPGAMIGRGFFIDHGMGVVIGETAVVGDNVTLYQGVTLGGTGKEKGKRHPTLRDNVVVGVGAKILGNITIGNNVRIGANAVVLQNVPDHCTVVGVPGVIVRRGGKKVAGVSLDHADLPDPVAERLAAIQREMRLVEEHLGEHLKQFREKHT